MTKTEIFDDVVSIMKNDSADLRQVLQIIQILFPLNTAISASAIPRAV